MKEFINTIKEQIEVIKNKRMDINVSFSMGDIDWMEASGEMKPLEAILAYLENVVIIVDGE